jgi:putative glutamine amidotransferase
VRPLIAVTTPIYTGENYRQPQIMLGAPYIAAIEDPGATAILLTPAHEAESIARILDSVQGLVLSGGEDIEPARYGQEPHPKLGSTNPARDEMEFAALEGALARRLPVLAICRGMQLLNVALGGTLYQDLPSLRPSEVTHQQRAAINQRWHSARVDEQSAMAEIFGTTELQINSFHHQGIDRLAPGLEATVWAEDGLIEGVEAREFPWVYGVQWHPERGEAETPGETRNPDRRLFWAFVTAVREHVST